MKTTPAIAALKFIGSFPAGAFGGFLCTFFILAFGGYIGRSGYTGTEYFGYMDLDACAGLASMFGPPFGVLLTPIGYLIFLQHVPVHKAALTCFCVTTWCGCVGAALGPCVAALTACIGFFAGCVCAAYWYVEHPATP